MPVLREFHPNNNVGGTCALGSALENPAQWQVHRAKGMCPSKGHSPTCPHCSRYPDSRTLARMLWVDLQSLHGFLPGSILLRVDCLAGVCTSRPGEWPSTLFVGSVAGTWMWRLGCPHMWAWGSRGIEWQSRWEEKKGERPRPTLFELPPLVWNSKGSKNFTFEPGLPNCYKCVFVKMGGEKNIPFNSLTWSVAFIYLDLGMWISTGILFQALQMLGWSCAQGPSPEGTRF